jgi:outer membrane protein OmpA-like peptidoglycan-associated protein
MRPLRTLIVLAVVALLGAPSTASAQMIPRSVEIDLMGGYYWFPSNVQNYNNSGIVGGRIGINFTQNLAFEATVGFVPTSTIHGNRTVNYIAPHFDLVVHLTPWRVVPYLAVGAGFEYSAINQVYAQGPVPAECDWKRDPYLTDQEISNSTESTSAGGCGYSVGHLKYENEHTNFVFDVGGGVKFLIFERGGLRIDGRYVLGHGPADVSSSGRQYGVPAAVGNEGNKQLAWFNTFHHIELTGSVFFLIGGGPGKDTDGDGIPDREDECPEAAEDVDGYEDEDGCPDRDNDGDGVHDTDDSCPMDPEDRDGWRDADGCPEDDNDADGLRDAVDGCPDEAEDKDGYQDGDGCPDPDNDGDGIQDTRDGCPLEAEDKDGFRDDDGCPEPDNDGDGILDGADQCPNAPEEFNGIADDDGCPEQDSDGDGVFDGRDRCPADMEDLDGYKDDDGCPDPDNDSDGILDNVDMCPMTPEDADSWEDGDGCPEADNDEDGILDDKDTCPTKPEDDDGYEDNDGCPDLDNDQDAILDESDKCPNHPETLNGFEDEDGCPDEIPEELKKFTGTIDDIKFKVNSDELLSSSYGTLNRAADVLSQFEGVRMEVQGHASSDGDDSYNLELSQKRAESVRRYLIGRGVNPDRLTAVGYGETKPLATNRTQEGRVENRRVEFQIIQD